MAGWKFSEGSGTSTVNTKGNSANNGALINGPTWTTGENGNGIKFDGTNDYVNISQSSTFNVTKYTVSAWVNVSATGNQDKLVFDNAGSNDDAGGYTLAMNYIGTGGTPYCVTVNATGVRVQTAHGTFNFSTHLNEWHHMACTFDGTTTIVYTDGVAEGSDNTPAITMATPPFPSTIGSISNLFTTYNFNGTIDEVSVYNRALSAAEIKALYHAKAAWCS